MKKLLVALLLGLTFVGCGNEVDMVKVGDVRFSHTTYTDEVYIIVRENGEEAYVVGRDNVEWSIDVYKEHGTFGKEVPVKRMK